MAALFFTCFVCEWRTLPPLTCFCGHSPNQDRSMRWSGEFARSSMGSLTVGVVSGDKLVWTRSYGNAKSKMRLPANQDTVYLIGSITKMFTATMLEDLVETGKVELTDPVEKHFPEVNRVQKRYKDAPPITLLQLATHTSGTVAGAGSYCHLCDRRATSMERNPDSSASKCALRVQAGYTVLILQYRICRAGSGVGAGCGAPISGISSSTDF
jgi:CubicO group peptidase (beta-lactamase class C family)